MELEHYAPPRQSRRGQLVDSLLLIVLVFLVLFGVTYFVNSSTSSGGSNEVKPLSALPITPAERQQYQRLIDENIIDLEGANQQVADSRPQSGWSKYGFSAVSVIVTFGVIALYFLFVIATSFKEYKQVIRERFGPSSSPRSAAVIEE